MPSKLWMLLLIVVTVLGTVATLMYGWWLIFVILLAYFLGMFSND